MNVRHVPSFSRNGLKDERLVYDRAVGLIELLQNSRNFAPEYDDGLTNHLPMCLVALARLGATDETLDTFYAHYARRLGPVQPGPDVARWRAQVETHGRDSTLRTALADLGEGLAGAAFHGLIRVAYASMHRDDQELAHALAYFEQKAMRLVEPLPSGSNADLKQLALRLREAQIPRTQARTISARLPAVAAHASFQSIIQTLATDDSTLNQASSLAAHAYLAADDFTSLHMLTGAHAVRCLRPWTEAPRMLDRALAVASLTCYVACGAPSFDASYMDELLSWGECGDLAITTKHDHVAKLVFACSEESNATGDPIFLAIASRVAKRGSA